MKFLTWNTGKKSTDLQKKVVKELVSENDPDVIVFQECTGAFLKSTMPNEYYEIPYPSRTGIDRRVRVFLKTSVLKHKQIYNEFNNKLIFVKIEVLTSGLVFNLAAVHLYSKINNSEREQMWKNMPFFSKIESLELMDSPKSDKTIIAGDFNYNPFEKDHFDSRVINSFASLKMLEFMYKSTSFERGKNMWYNPMWNLLGDYDLLNQSRRINGTYYRYSDNENHPFWNMFDGFLVRSSIAEKIEFKSMSILTETKTSKIKFLKPLVISESESLIDERISDHLPVVITINI